MQIFDHTVPQISTWHFERLAFELQEIERKDRWRNHPHDDPGGGAQRVAKQTVHDALSHESSATQMSGDQFLDRCLVICQEVVHATFGTKLLGPAAK